MGNSNIKGQRLAIGLAATGSLLMAGHASALEFGSISLGSHLNQPLTAQIVLSSLSDAERASLSVRIASPDMFERFGIARSSDVDNLDVSTRAGSAGQMIVQISTRNAVREPFVDFLLEANTSSGSALREYTVLLNPASTSNPASQRAPQSSVLRRTQTPAASGYAESSTMPASGSMSGRSSSQSGPGRYGPVTDGETLYSIALAQRPPGASVPQMELALFQANPRAFAGGMSSLLRGATLDIPSADAVRQISKVGAHQRIAQSNAAARSTAGQSAESEPGDSVSSTGATQASGQLPPASLADSTAPTTAGSADPADNNSLTQRGNGVTGNAQFGQLSMPPAGSWATPASNASLPTGTASTNGQSGSPIAGNDAISGTDTGPGSPTASTPSQPALADKPGQTGEAGQLDTASAPNAAVATPPAPGASSTSPVVFDDAGQGNVQDVAAGGSDSLLSPRNLLLGLLLVGVVGGGLLLRRRRQYKPLPLNFDDTAEDNHDMAPAAATIGTTTAQAARVAPVLDEPAAGDIEAGVVGPEHALAEAAARVSVGEYASARRCIEDGLRDHPHDAGLQDKLLDMDYQFGDAARFQQNYTRFEPDMRADSLRHARIMDKGRALLPDDPRFTPVAVAGGAAAATSAVADDEFVPASLRRHDDNAASMEDAALAPADRASKNDAYADDALSMDDYSFEESDEIAPTERQHDQGSGEGLSFELDDTPLDESSKSTQASRASDPDAGRPAGQGGELSLDMINPADFSLDDTSASDDSAGLDGNTVEIRLDLARMYMEMEDNAMARPLLEEVMANGDETQKRTAQSLLELI